MALSVEVNKQILNLTWQNKTEFNVKWPFTVTQGRGHCYIFATDSLGLSSFKFSVVGSENACILKQSA